MFGFIFGDTSSPEASGEPETNYFLVKISSKIEGLPITFSINFLLFIRLINCSRYKASYLFLHSKVSISFQSVDAFVKLFLK